MDWVIGFPWGACIGALALFALANLAVWAAKQTGSGARSPKTTSSPASDETPPPRPLIPTRAAVKPRVRLPKSEAALPLEDEIRELLEEDPRAALLLQGGPGTGKTTALEHLAFVFSQDPRIRVLEDPDLWLLDSLVRQQLVVFTTSFKEMEDWHHLAKLKMAPWCRDDLIEYLLHVNPDACASVMERIDSKLILDYQGCPEIWRVILDTLAADAEIPNARTALSRYLAWLEPDLKALKRIGRDCLDRVTSNSPDERSSFDLPGDELERLLRHRNVQILVAAEQLAEELQGPILSNEDLLKRFFPRALVRETAAILAEDVDAMTRLLDYADQELPSYSLIFSLLHAEGVDWSPTFSTDPNLSFAYLDEVQWPGVNLKCADVRHADFRKANLAGADLEEIQAGKAKLQRADLREAFLGRGDFRHADLSGANCSACQAEDAIFSHARLNGAVLSRANLARAVFTDAELKNATLEHADLTGGFLTSSDLTGASFAEANLTSAKLVDANLQETDFTRANLSGSFLMDTCLHSACFDDADFRDADLRSSDLEGLECRNVSFENANLKLASLTGTRFANANFARACLRGSRLAEICWEGADLRGADLRGATFHMGSSRSGLLFTGIASEGTRTGFYTDDYEDQSFRAPEEIRKANLCGADLRGANLENVDFYLVDLRGAIFDSEQAGHLKKCGAILSS